MEIRAAFTDELVARLRAGGSVVLRGPAGIGKTTLVRATVDRLRDRHGVTVVRAVASETAQRLPLGAFAGVLAQPFAGTAVERVTAVIDAVRRDADDAVLVIDDAHLLDDESAAAVHHVAAMGLVPVFLSVRSEAVWPDAVRRVWRDGAAVPIEVPTLPVAEVAELMESMLGGITDGATAARFLAASEGNPLLLRELVIASRLEGQLRSANDIWTAETVASGATTRDLLDGRVAALDGAIRVVAELLAVGGAVPRRIVDALVPAGDVERAVRATVARARDADGLLEAHHPLLADAVRRAMEPGATVARLQQLVGAGAVDGPDAADLVVPMALWMLALDDRHAADADVLWAAADRSMDQLRLDMAEQLAEAAARAGGGARAADLLVRIRANQGKEVPTGDLSPDQRRQRAQGMAEAFLIGLGPLDGVRAALADAAGHLTPGPARTHVEALDLHVALTVGAPQTVDLDRMVAFVHANAGTVVGGVAAMRPAEVLIDAGRCIDALALLDAAEAGRVPDNEFHRYALGRSRAMALHAAGRTAEARRVIDERLGGSDTPAAVTFRAAACIELARAAGRPAEAEREARQILAVLGAIDAAGLRTWALAVQREAVAWMSGQDHGTPAAVPPGPQARPLALAVALADAERFVVASRFADAARRATALTERAEQEGQWWWALRGLHLAGRLRPTAALASRAAAVAARCQGEWAALLADHVGALSGRDAVALEKCAHGFERIGQEALALEAFAAAATHHRAAGGRPAAVRCRAAATRLEGAGVLAVCMPRGAESDALTRREVEVATHAGTGLTNAAIASALGLSTRTVETHLQRAYRKLGTSDREALAAALADASTATTPPARRTPR